MGVSTCNVARVVTLLQPYVAREKRRGQQRVSLSICLDFSDWSLTPGLVTTLVLNLLGAALTPKRYSVQINSVP